MTSLVAAAVPPPSSRLIARRALKPNTEALESCTGLAPGMINLSIDQIRQTVQPTADQEAAGT